MERLADRVGGLLPRGRELPEEIWQRRHRAIVRICFAAGFALLLLAWFWGYDQPTAVLVLLAVAAPAAVAAVPSLGRSVRAGAATLSLMGASVALTHLWSGVTEAHFAFFVMVGVVSLYQSWVPFGIALVVVAAHHGVVGTLYPHVVFGHSGDGHSPWAWAGIHAAFVLAASLAHLASWRLNEDQELSDSLTGLANRTQLEEVTARALARGGPVSVLFVDVDDFKDVNDSRGHAAGDELLRVVAERMQACVRPGDVVARMGGDEFAVVIAGDAELAHAVGERLLVSLALPVPTDHGLLTVHASVGLAVAADDDRSAGALLRNADLAMHLAKAQGKNRLVGYADGMAEAARRRAGLQQDLLAAVAEGQLELHYQPTVRLSDGRTTGFEALVRWHHPERGLVPPVEFIPLAEESGAIVEIGRWVLRTALRQGATWISEQDTSLRMAVNLSPRQLFDTDIVADVVEALTTSGFPAELLTLELTEGVLVRDVDAVVAQLEALRALGVRIAIDDFGTGFSSLSYLRKLPADVLKIDRSFVTDLPGGRSATTLIASIVELARTLGLDVVAEGVETDDQRLALRDLNCGSAQGFFFARPQPAAAAGAALDGSVRA